MIDENNYGSSEIWSDSTAINCMKKKKTAKLMCPYSYAVTSTTRQIAWSSNVSKRTGSGSPPSRVPTQSKPHGRV